jgi:hypothetical protein
MTRTLKTVLLALSLSTGCATVSSSMPSITNATGEAWYTEATGFLGITWGSKVWYCPPPTSGAATCREARLVELTKDEIEKEKAK